LWSCPNQISSPPDPISSISAHPITQRGLLPPGRRRRRRRNRRRNRRRRRRRGSSSLPDFP